MTETTPMTGGLRRRHATGDATRVLLMEAAERLFGERGVEGVTLREIQVAAGQSNSSVITYHFGSKTGLVRALVEFRYQAITERREALLEELRATGRTDDARSVVWLMVLPLVDSIRAGEMFVPFLARLSENPRAHAEYWPQDLEDASLAILDRLVPDVLVDLPPRIRRGRGVQLYNSVLNLLGEQARSRHRFSDLQLHNYVDGWVGMLTAPMSAQTAALLGE